MDVRSDSTDDFKRLVRLEQQLILKVSCLSKIVDGVYRHGDTNTIAMLALSGLSDVLAVKHSLVAVGNKAFLTIIATQGKTYPMESRLPKMGGLANIFNLSCQFTICSVQNKLLFLLDESDTESAFVIPLGWGGVILGIMAYCVPQAITDEHHGFLQMLSGILSVMMQKSHPKINQVHREELSNITPREREVLALLPKGYSNPEIAKLLGIASGTVKVHVEHILSKLQLKDRTQAAVRAVELGL